MRTRWLVVPLLLLTLACRRAPAPAGTGAGGASEPAGPPQPAPTQAPAAASAGGAGEVPGGQPSAAAGAPVGQPPAVKPVPATLPDVLARVNGESIAKTDFEQAIRNLEARAGQGVPFEQRNAVYRQMLDQLIGLRLLIQETKVRKVAVTDAEVEGRLSQIRQQFPDEAAFKKTLTDQRMTLDTLKQETRAQMLVAKVIEAEIAPTVSVTDGDIQTFYDQNKAQFNQPEAVQASHILIRFPEKADEAARQQARSRAEALLKQITSGGDFAALAREFSEDSGSAAKGGDLGFVPKGQTVPAFETAAFALKSGEISSLVETAFGYHIIKGGDHRPARLVPLAEVSEQIQQFLVQQQTQDRTQAFVNQLRAKAKVEILM